MQPGHEWHAFVKRAIEGEPDDPFVAMLRRAIASGSEIVRVNLVQEQGLAYRILVSRLKHLSVMEIPHSASFTRWSLANGVRMESAEEETRRFLVLLEEKFPPIVEEYGKEYAGMVLIERIRALDPVRAPLAIGDANMHPTAPGQTRIRAGRMVDAFLAAEAAALGVALHYPETEAAAILDEALERFARGLFHQNHYPESKYLGHATGPDRQSYRLDFHGEDEGAAVIAGPSPARMGEMVELREVHRSYARDAEDALARLQAWLREAGWTIDAP